MKTEKEAGEVNEIDEEKSDEEKTSSDNDSDLNDKDSSNNISGEKDAALELQKNNSVISPPVITKTSGTIQIPGGNGGKSSGPTSPNNNILNNTGNMSVHN